MGADKEQHLYKQVERAREALGRALGQTQDISGEAVDLERVSRSLAGAVKSLFDAEKIGLLKSNGVAASMDYLRGALELFQEVEVRNDNLDAATTTVARTMAILFPVFKEISTISEEEDKFAGMRKSQLPPLADDPAGSERRLAERRAIEADIGVQSETNFYTGFSMDISSGGLFVATYDVSGVGTQVNVNFKIPRGPIMSLEGIVRWVREHNELVPDMVPGMGIMFDDLTKGQKRALNKYISRSEPFFYEH